MIVLMAAALPLFVRREVEEAARAHTEAADPGHQHHSVASADVNWRARLTSAQAWSDVADNFRGDWQMLWREISVGFLLAGFVAQLPDDFFRGLFVHSAPAPIPAIENAVVGPVIVLFWLTVRRGETDPVCGMKVDRATAITRPATDRAGGAGGANVGETAYFCSAHCAHEHDRAAGQEHPRPAAG